MSESEKSSIEQVKSLHWFYHFGLFGSVTAFFVARLSMHNTTLTVNVLEIFLTYAYIWLSIKLPGKTFFGGIPIYVIGPTVVTLLVNFIISKAFHFTTLYPFMGIISVAPMIVGLVGYMFGIITLSKNKVARSIAVLFLIIAMMFEYSAVSNVNQESLELAIQFNPKSDTINLVFAQIWLTQVFAYQALMVVCRFPVQAQSVEQRKHTDDMAA